MLLFGTLPGICFGQGMTSFLYGRNVRKEDPAKAILAKRGQHPGLICILSAREPCSAYKPWRNQQTGKCVHYGFYFLDEELGAFPRARANMAAWQAN